MQNQVQVKVNEQQLLQNLRHAFTDKLSCVREMLQNARRAGATRVDVFLDSDARVLEVRDNGCGIEDFGKLLSVAESGWDETVIEQEAPYGLGFLSAAYACERIIVTSGGQRLATLTESLIAMESLPVENAPISDETVIRLEGLAHSIQERDVETIVTGFELPVFLNGKELSRPHAIHESAEELVGVGRLGRELTLSSRTHVYLQGFCVQRAEGRRFADQSGNVVHLDSRLFRGRMPDRSRVEDHDEVMEKVRRAVRAAQRAYLKAELAKLGDKEFCVRYFNTLVLLGMDDIAMALPCVPGDVLGRLSEHPHPEDLHGEGTSSHENFRDKAEVIWIRELEEHKVIPLTTDQDAQFDVCGRGGAVYMLHYLDPARFTFGMSTLTSGHWLRAYEEDIQPDEISVEYLESKPISGLRLTEVSGDIRIIEAARVVFHADAIGRFEYPVNEVLIFTDHVGGVVVLPAGFLSNPDNHLYLYADLAAKVFGGALEDGFYDEAYLKQQERAFAEAFFRFQYQHDPVALIDRALRQSGIERVDSLRGKAFDVRIEDDGKLTVSADAA